MLKNTIYARNGKTNYPIDDGVSHFLIQQLFAIRTGHHLTTRERGILYLDDMENWILLERKKEGILDGQYTIIAGHIEMGESVLDAIIRESKEEAGINS